MATLEVGVPLKTREAVVEGPANLPLGRYRIVLVVSGPTDKSEPAALTLKVVRRRILRPPIR
jgi:hypothetical protein